MWSRLVLSGLVLRTERTRPHTDQFQACSYNAMNALEDVQMQIHGAVLVILSLGNPDATMLYGIVMYDGRRADQVGRLSAED